MRLYWIRLRFFINMTGVLIEDVNGQEQRRCEDTQGEDILIRQQQQEIEGYFITAKRRLRPSGPGRTRKICSSTGFCRGMVPTHLSQISARIKRKLISVILRHLASSIFLWHPKENDILDKEEYRAYFCAFYISFLFSVFFKCLK